jgi:hypothetical protein
MMQSRKRRFDESDDDMVDDMCPGVSTDDPMDTEDPDVYEQTQKRQMVQQHYAEQKTGDPLRNVGTISLSLWASELLHSEVEVATINPAVLGAITVYHTLSHFLATNTAMVNDDILRQKLELATNAHAILTIMDTGKARTGIHAVMQLRLCGGLRRVRDTLLNLRPAYEETVRPPGFWQAHNENLARSE